jgi:hypothetical protein
VSAAAAAVREHDDTGCPVRNRELPAEANRSDGDLDLLVAQRRVVADRARRHRFLACRALQQVHDLLVGGLAEVGVEPADTQEPPRCLQTDQFVDLCTQPGGGIGRADRHREHDPCSTFCLRHLARRAGGGTGGDPVVDQYGGPTR